MDWKHPLNVAGIACMHGVCLAISTGRFLSALRAGAYSTNYDRHCWKRRLFTGCGLPSTFTNTKLKMVHATSLREAVIALTT
jgi:hypothetical protein